MTYSFKITHGVLPNHRVSNIAMHLHPQICLPSTFFYNFGSNKLKLKIAKLHIVIVSVMMMLGTALYGQGTWEKLDVPTSVFLKSVYFVDSLYGWAVGDTGTILHTKDGGDSWEIQNPGTDNELFEVFFLDRDYGWAASYRFSTLPYGTDLLKTNDGGETWTLYPYPEDNIFITSIFYFDTLNGWMGGRPHAIVKTSDGGYSWDQAAVDTSILAFFPVLNISFLNENIGFACGGILDIAGVIWHTYNGGDTWAAIDPSFAPADEIYNVHIFDSLNVIGAGGDPDFGYGVATIHTNNGAQSWEYFEHGVAGNAFDIEFRTEDDAWCPLGFQNKFVYSEDAGETWEPMETPEGVSIFDIAFTDSLHGFAVGQNGAMLRFIPPVSTKIKNSWLEENRFRLQITPNPLSSNAKVNFEVKEFNCSVEMFVLNAHGSYVLALVNDNFSAGNYNLKLPESMFSPGIYFLVCIQKNENSGVIEKQLARFVVLP